MKKRLQGRQGWRASYRLSLAALLLAVLSVLPASAKNLGFMKLGQISGVCKSMAVAGNIAYLGEGGSLVLLDYANPARPKRLAQFNFDELVEDVAVSGRLLCVANGKAGLFIYYLITPTRPSLVGKFAWTAREAKHVALQGSRAYLASDTDLAVLDLSNPVRPKTLGSLTGFNFIQKLQALGNFVYVSQVFDGLQIVDARNPQDLKPRGKIEIGILEDAVVAGTQAYVIGGAGSSDEDSLWIVNLANPDQPIFQGRYPLFFPNILALNGGIAWVFDGEGVKAIDVRNAAKPVLLGRYKLASVTIGLRIAISGKVALISTLHEGFHFLDVSNPATPRRLAIYEVPGPVTRVQLVKNRAYVIDSRGMRIFSLANWVKPEFLGIYRSAHGAGDVVVDKNHAYLGRYQGVDVIDITNPAAPVRKATIATTEQVCGLDLQGTRLYIAYGFDHAESGLLIADVSKPERPVVIGRCLTRDWPSGVKVENNIAWISFHWGRVQLVDVSNITAPVLKGYYQNPQDFFYYNDVAVRGGIGCVPYSWVRGLYGIQFFKNIKNVPTLVGAYNHADGKGAGVAAAVAGPYVFEALMAGGLDALDVRNPAKPILAGHYDGLKGVGDVMVDNNIIYAADADWGLVALRFNDLKPR